MSSSTNGLPWDPARGGHYRLTQRPDGMVERTYIQATPLPPRTSSNNPRALPLNQNATGSSNPRPPTGPPQPVEPYGAQRPPGPQGGSTGPYGSSLGPHPVQSYGTPAQSYGTLAQSYGTPAQYGYATTGSTQSLAAGVSGLTMAANRPRVASTDPNQATTASASGSRVSAAAISRPPAPSAGDQSYTRTTSGIGGQRTQHQTQPQQSSQQGGTGYGGAINVSGSQTQRVYSGLSTAPSATSKYVQASATAYGSHMQQAAPQRTTSSQAGYTTSSMLSPYSTHAAPVAAPGMSQQLPTRTSSWQPAQGPGTVATFPGQVQVGYKSRTGAQGSTEGRQTARNDTATNQYRHRRHSSVNDETLRDDISQYLVRGTTGHAEVLDPRFHVRENHHEFFKLGRVFKMLSWEPQGSSQPPGPLDTSVAKYESVQVYGEVAFAKIYRYVVVNAKPKQGYSMCLRISTNGNRGTAKKILDHREHSIIYTSKEAPPKLPEEKKLIKDPIHVVPFDGHLLEATSRVNFAKAFPVEHNVKVLEVGTVSEDHLRKFLGYWENETEKGFPSKRSERKSESSRNQRVTPGQGRRRHH